MTNSDFFNYKTKKEILQMYLLVATIMTAVKSNNGLAIFSVLFIFIIATLYYYYLISSEYEGYNVLKFMAFMVAITFSMIMYATLGTSTVDELYGYVLNPSLGKLFVGLELLILLFVTFGSLIVVKK
jgi:hypothetical protein